MTRRTENYSAAELAELADGLERLLETIADGSLVADSATIRRLEGACAAISRSLLVGLLASTRHRPLRLRTLFPRRESDRAATRGIHACERARLFRIEAIRQAEARPRA